MKLYKLFLMGAAVAGIFSSCSEDGFWDAYDTTSTATYSFTTKSNSYNLLPSDTLPDLKVTVNRNTNDKDVAIPLNININNDIITLDTNAIVTKNDTSYIVFKKGEFYKDINIYVDDSNLKKGFEYKAELSFLVDSVDFFEHNYSISGNKSYVLTFLQDYTWVPVGNVQYTEGLINAFYNVQDLTYKVAAEQAVENHAYIRLVDPYGKAWPYNGSFSAVDNAKHYMTLNCEDADGVYIDGIHNSGIEMADGELRFVSLAYYYMMNGYSFDEVKGKGLCGTLDENYVITFPAGAILICEANYNGGAWYNSNKKGTFAIDLSTATLLED